MRLFVEGKAARGGGSVAWELLRRKSSLAKLEEKGIFRGGRGGKSETRGGEERGARLRKLVKKGRVVGRGIGQREKRLRRCGAQKRLSGLPENRSL